MICWPVLSAQALSLDDAQYLTENKSVQNPSLESAQRFLFEVFEPSTVAGYYQPLSMISLMLDAALGGNPDNLRPFHRSSLALHVGNTILVIVLLYLLFRQPWPAALVGLLYGLHPLAVEPLAWIAERKTLLGAFCALFSLTLYAHYARKQSRPLYVLTFAFYILGMMSKPTIIPIPALLLLLDYWPLRRLRWHTLLEKVPFFVAGTVFALITLISQRNTAAVVMPAASNPGSISLTLCYSATFYLRKIFCPTGMSSLYVAPEPFSLSNPVLLAAVATAAVLVIAFLLSLRWTRALLAGGMFFFLAILPTLGIVGFQTAIAADRHAYLPMFGFLLPATWLLARIWGRPPPSRPARGARFATILVVLVLAVGETLVTRRTLAHWRDTETLFRHMTTVSPRSHQAHNSLANCLVAQDRVDEARRHYHIALDIEPAYFKAHVNLAGLLVGAGESSGALAHYQTALRLRPDAVEARVGLATALFRFGHTDEAINHCEGALSLQPDHVGAHYNLAVALAAAGRATEALARYTQTLRLDENHYKAHYNLGLLLFQAQRYAEAADHFHAVIRIYPAFTATYVNLGYVLRQLGQYDQAVRIYQQGIRATPSDATMPFGLGICLEEQGRLAEAADAYRQALQLDPNHAEAGRRLDRILASTSSNGAPQP